MTLLKEFLIRNEEDIKRGVSHKNSIIKSSIVAYMAVNGRSALSELSKELHVSVPTITKLVGELVDEGIVTDNGKLETPGGRRPNTFDLADAAIYFAGVDICREDIRFVISDLRNNIIFSDIESSFCLQDTQASLDRICSTINGCIDRSGICRSNIIGMGVCVAGRVNPYTGRSYMYFTSNDKSLCQILEDSTGMKVHLENDTRSRCYAEYFMGNIKNEKNVIYLHLGQGVAIGIIIEGKIYYGKSGFAGEFGHAPFFDNDIICACGKKGCLETEVSGMALVERAVALITKGRNTMLVDTFRKSARLHVNDIVEAAKRDDTLAIELIQEAAEKIGKSIAFLMNIFNPELVVVGGNLSRAGDILMLPVKAATNKFSLNLVHQDTKFRISQMGEMTGALGAAMLFRNKIIGLS